MQLAKLTDKLKPITIAAGLFSSAALMAYSDIDLFSGILTTTNNNKTSEYIHMVDNNIDGLLLQKIRFQNYLKNWERDVLFSSSPKAIIENTNFQAIISMGYSAVPFIMQEIESKPSSLVWALNIIYNRKITNNPNTTITEACKLWVKALKK